MFFIRNAGVKSYHLVLASLAIIISCLVCFGLAAYTAGRRTREIGIRALGASVSGIGPLQFGKIFVAAGIVVVVVFHAYCPCTIGLKIPFIDRDINWWVFIIAGGRRRTS